MEVEIYIEKKMNRKWVQNDSIFFTGCFFLDDQLLKESEVLELLLKVETIEDCNTLLEKLNGFFSFIIRTTHRVFAVVDRVRSIPLFYTSKDNYICISNDSEYVRAFVGDVYFDPIAVQEFTSRQVTGADTLFKNLKQVQTGEVIEFYLDSLRNVVVNNMRYFAFTHSEKYNEADRPLLENRMISIFSHCIDRLVTYAQGRQLVLPLSAGYDSRFIALMLYKRGVKNVLCFSYGKEGNFEAEISKQVASILGFTWEFIEYTDDVWQKWCRTNEYLKYSRVASGWVSLPHAQDWPAVCELKKRNKINDNAVFIPGHVGDSLAGSDVPFVATRKCKANATYFFYNLFIYYYNNLQDLPDEILPNGIENKWIVFKDRVFKNLGIASISSAAECADAYEKWNWQEHNPKFIINSVRVYEFWGYDWYLPFVDKEFMEYWQDVPLSLRYGKKMYNETVDKFFFELTGEYPPHHKESDDCFYCLKFIKDLIRYTWLHRLYLKLLFLLKISSLEKNNTNCASAEYDREIVERYSHYRGGLNFIGSIQFLRNIPNIMKLEL